MLSRRQVLQLFSAATAASLLPRVAVGEKVVQQLSGEFIELHLREQMVAIDGQLRLALTINNQLPGPTLALREGQHVHIRVHNHLSETSSIHWHGLILPANMDGVPGFSFDGIPSGGYYDYHFDIRQAGTYWYHSHSGMQEQRGLYGAIVIAPREQTESLREHTLLFSDWSDDTPQHILSTLKKQADFYNTDRRTLADFLAEARQRNISELLAERWAWQRMRMSSTDLADVSGKTYRYLLNGRSAGEPWQALFKAGETVRLRLINASAMSYFDFRIPGVKLTVVAADGQEVQPVVVDEIRLAVAETYDVLVQLGEAASYTLFAQSMDRSGSVHGVLAQQWDAVAVVPPVDAREELQMSDMGHDHADHASHGSSHAAMKHPKTNHDEMHHATMSHGAGEHAGHARQTSSAHAESAAAAAIVHPATENNNPLVDMQTSSAQPKLSDPGIGLRNNQRRVLVYSDLRSNFAQPDPRAPSREIELHLTGHMERFAWSIDGVPYERANPIVLRYGERVRFTLVNDTMMHHPMHLHGLWSDLEDEHGKFLVRKHTVDIPPGARRSFRVTADALGRWAFHCHMLLHMEVGMFREVRVVEA